MYDKGGDSQREGDKRQQVVYGIKRRSGMMPLENELEYVDRYAYA
jgi:hypothetical protein